MLKTITSRVSGVLVASLVLTSCGPMPLESIGDRSSGWLGEPGVSTTLAVQVVAPDLAPATSLAWSNDDIVAEIVADVNAIVANVFARREGDRFIQASRAEIASVLPGLEFPASVPYGARWVSSQLVIENSGQLSDDPAAAFGIWSAEPYSRSRSVAQMAVLTVAIDREGAAEVIQPDAEISCARFADRTADRCEIVTMAGRTLWKLSSAAGTTFAWFESPYRYELFGRTFVSPEVLQSSAARSVPLSDLVETGS